MLWKSTYLDKQWIGKHIGLGNKLKQGAGSMSNTSKLNKGNKTLFLTYVTVIWWLLFFIFSCVGVPYSQLLPSLHFLLLNLKCVIYRKPICWGAEEDLKLGNLAKKWIHVLPHYDCSSISCIFLKWFSKFKMSVRLQLPIHLVGNVRPGLYITKNIFTLQCIMTLFPPK